MNVIDPESVVCTFARKVSGIYNLLFLLNVMYRVLLSLLYQYCKHCNAIYYYMFHYTKSQFSFDMLQCV